MRNNKTEKIAGIVLAAGLLLYTISSTYHFLGTMGVSVHDWIVLNSCAPVSFLYVLFFIIYMATEKRTYLMLTFLPIFYLGTASMFIIPWNSGTITAHAGHIIMTLNIAWAVYTIIGQRDYKALGIGLLMSMLLFVPYIGYTQMHLPEVSSRVFAGFGG